MWCGTSRYTPSWSQQVLRLPSPFTPVLGNNTKGLLPCPFRPIRPYPNRSNLLESSETPYPQQGFNGPWTGFSLIQTLYHWVSYFRHIFSFISLTWDLTNQRYFLCELPSTLEIEILNRPRPERSQSFRGLQFCSLCVPIMWWWQSSPIHEENLSVTRTGHLSA